MQEQQNPPEVACPNCHEYEPVESGWFKPQPANPRTWHDSKRFNRYCESCELAFDWVAGVNP